MEPEAIREVTAALLFTNKRKIPIFIRSVLLEHGFSIGKNRRWFSADEASLLECFGFSDGEIDKWIHPNRVSVQEMNDLFSRGASKSEISDYLKTKREEAIKFRSALPDDDPRHISNDALKARIVERYGHRPPIDTDPDEVVDQYERPDLEAQCYSIPALRELLKEYEFNAGALPTLGPSGTILESSLYKKPPVAYVKKRVRTFLQDFGFKISEHRRYLASHEYLFIIALGGEYLIVNNIAPNFLSAHERCYLELSGMKSLSDARFEVRTKLERARSLAAIHCSDFSKVEPKLLSDRLIARTNGAPDTTLLDELFRDPLFATGIDFNDYVEIQLASAIKLGRIHEVSADEFRMLRCAENMLATNSVEANVQVTIEPNISCHCDSKYAIQVRCKMIICLIAAEDKNRVFDVDMLHAWRRAISTDPNMTDHTMPYYEVLIDGFECYFRNRDKWSKINMLPSLRAVIFFNIFCRYLATVDLDKTGFDARCLSTSESLQYSAVSLFGISWTENFNCDTYVELSKMIVYDLDTTFGEHHKDDPVLDPSDEHYDKHMELRPIKATIANLIVNACGVVSSFGSTLAACADAVSSVLHSSAAQQLVQRRDELFRDDVELCGAVGFTDRGLGSVPLYPPADSAA